MDSKKTHKLSKASVAAVLAASGVIVAMPQPTHAYTFSDLNPNADYYQPVMDLNKRNIATGYSDGTYRPNEAITRADAARMIALSIKINTKNPKNPKFKDVQTSNTNYKYIAALAEAGIINGYPDNTYKPDEYITRSQMAKIMTLGYKFGVSTKLTNNFQDVPATNANAYFIQTLVDLNITKGITPISFEPSSTVTRGQMATFIWRSEKADKGTPVYTVGDITEDAVYINGVPYSIAPSLSSIFNASNKRILSGAHIEGSFTSTTLTAVSKLTLNASGTSTSLLALDGDYSTFGGELIINGSYLRLKNIDLTGRVEVAETPRKSLANYKTNPLYNARIAGINGFGFIDWGKPTDPDEEGFLNPGDNESLTEKPDPTKPPHKQPYQTRMPKIEKYVDFSNSTVKNLLITQNRSFVSAEETIDRITVQKDVAQYELYADANAMYIDTDVNVTVFGVNDIKYVYKNTLKNVFFHTDSYYDYLYVTTGSGFIDIGDHVYIDNVIIPPNKTVNDIFDDYENDNGNIGWIEDENGNPVDRDPVEDTVIPDDTAPKILELAVSAGGTLANVSLKADEDGTYYYIVKKTDEKPPSINEIKKGGGKYSGSGSIKQDTPVNFTVNDLETLTEYTIYVIVIDGSENVSNKASKDFKTIDGQPPNLTLTKGDKMYGGKRVQFKIKPTEAGTYYYYIRQKRSDAGPTVDDIIKNHTGTGKATEPGEIIVTEKYYGAKPNLEAIQPNTTYEIFAVMVDSSGNKMRTVSDIEITTEGLDSEHPYVNNPILKRDDKEKSIFELTVSEKLDKKSAEDVNNYILSGTGIINVSEQKEIKPSKVEYVESENKVRLTIPSITALVKGDTIRATILPGVTDLAENPFENIDTVPVQQVPRNYAEYKHEDKLPPEITIDKVEEGPEQYLVTVTTKKAGTYYYMILPDTFDFKDITSRDFVDEFSEDPKLISGKFQKPDGSDHYLKSPGLGVATFGEFTFPLRKPSDLNPFTTYSIYMVLKDRSGQLSDIENKLLIKDTKPPLVSDFEVNNIDGKDTAVALKIHVDEAGYVYTLPIQKYVLEDGVRKLNLKYFDKDGKLREDLDFMDLSKSNDERFKLFEGHGAKKPKGEDIKDKGEYSFTVEGLHAHEEYGMYIGVIDMHGNFTVKEKSNNPIISNDEPLGDVMKDTFYTDGTKPHIVDSNRKDAVKPVNVPYILGENEALIYRDNLDKSKPNDITYTITFNEAVMRQSDIGNFNETNLDTSNWRDIINITGNGVTDLDFEFVSYTAVKSTEKSTLVIKPKNQSHANQSITVTMEDSDDAYDYKGQNRFDISKIGRYIYPSASKVNIKEIWHYNSHHVRIRVESTVSISHGQRFYYAIMNSNASKAPTFKDVRQAAEGGAKIEGMTISGTDVMDESEEASRRWDFKLPTNAPNIFGKDQRIYFYTVDNFGNIIQGKNSDDSKDYIEVPAKTSETP